MTSMEDPEGGAKPAKEGLWRMIGGGPLTIAIALHALLLLLGAFWVVQVIREPEKTVDFLPVGGGGGGGERGIQVAQKRMQAIQPSASVKRVFAEGAASSFTLPDPGDSFGELSALSSLGGGGMAGGLGMGGVGAGGGPGRGNGAGAGLGGGGTGRLFGMIPETMRKRCTGEDRLQRLREHGGTPACEDAVSRALAWLKSRQNSDGSWGSQRKPGLTGLVLLAYLGRCETPVSQEYGDSSTRAITYLVNLANSRGGKLTEEESNNTWPYEHAIATYALAEAFTFCREAKIELPGLKEAVSATGQWIIDHQHKKGGWAYHYLVDGDQAHVDVSVTGWHLQALKALTHTRLTFKGMNAAISRGLDWLNSCQMREGGYGYQNFYPLQEYAPYHALTGKGMLCNQMLGRGNSVQVSRALRYILEGATYELEYDGQIRKLRHDGTAFNFDGERCDIYGLYYESQALLWQGGEHWKRYLAKTRFDTQLVERQHPDGSWPSPGGGVSAIKASSAWFHDDFVQRQGSWAISDAAVYRTALCTLTLEVFYRFLSTGGESGPGI